jgi:hypothetical protein
MKRHGKRWPLTSQDSWVREHPSFYFSGRMSPTNTLRISYPSKM